jgi:hypothetical protein
MIESDLVLPPGDDTLREHLGYSPDLIAMALRELAEPPHADLKREWFRQMSIIEVFWSQTRILVEFFTGALASKTTSAAEHFTQGHVQYEFPFGDKDIKKMMYDQIAHMNYARTTEKEMKLQPIDMFKIADAITRAVQKFESSLGSDARKIWDARISGHQQIDAGLVYASGEPSACGTFGTIGSTGTFSEWRQADAVEKLGPRG